MIYFLFLETLLGGDFFGCAKVYLDGSSNMIPLSGDVEARLFLFLGGCSKSSDSSDSKPFELLAKLIALPLYRNSPSSLKGMFPYNIMYMSM